MGDTGIPPPDFNGDAAFNPINEPFMEEETDAFRNLMESDSKNQQRVQDEAKKQVINQEEAMKQVIQKEEMKQAGKYEEREKGIEEEDAKKTTEEEDSKASEERRQASLKKGGQKQAQRYERVSKNIEKNQRVGQEGDQQDLESKDSLQKSKELKQKPFTQKTFREKDSSAELDHTLRHEQQKMASKTGKLEVQREESSLKKSSKKEDVDKPNPLEKKSKDHVIQSIATNIALTSQPLEGTISQKGQLHTDSTQIDRRKDLEQLAKQLIDEAEVLKKGDEIRTTITVDLPDSIFNKGKVTISTFKYRPLEVNLKFENFSSEGTQVIRQNQGHLKNVLKINSLNVHQLDVIE